MKIQNFTIVALLILSLVGCVTNDDNNSRNGLVPIHLKRVDDAHALATIGSNSDDVLGGTLPVEFKAEANWERVETTHYIIKSLALLVGQGKVKVVVDENGGIAFEPLQN